MVSEEWKHHVKDISESGRLSLQGLSPQQEGIYTCELSNEEETYITSTFLKIEEDQGETESITNPSTFRSGKGQAFPSSDRSVHLFLLRRHKAHPRCPHLCWRSSSRSNGCCCSVHLL
ncbi:hypothetical protein ILYODFUR_029960 [Ilyodon furcidens]|uniref:Ig-like domain-containing protein n=1 Tax=Ilyodon furcidens TaxID=33524 RepID=A0ABV0UZI9_9TELE